MEKVFSSEDWKRSYEIVKELRYVYLDKESFFTPIILSEDWVFSRVDGFKTTFYSKQALTQEDIISFFKATCLKNLEVSHEWDFSGLDVEPYLKHLTLLEVPICNFEYGYVYYSLLDIYLNLNKGSCLRFKGAYSMFKKSDDFLLDFFANIEALVLSNKHKTKLYGRVFYQPEGSIYFNLYPQTKLRDVLLHSKDLPNLRIDVNIVATDIAGIYINELIRFNGHYPCVDELYFYEALEGYCYCCDSPVPAGGDFVYDNNGNLYCSNCMDYLACCDYCDQWFDTRDYALYRLHNYEVICEFCLEDRRI